MSTSLRVDSGVAAGNARAIRGTVRTPGSGRPFRRSRISGRARAGAIRPRAGRPRAGHPASGRPRVGRRRTERLEYDPGRLRVDADVPFGRRGRVAGRAITPAHDHQASQKARQLGLAQHRQGHVGERRERDQDQLPGAAAGFRDDQVGAEARGDRHGRRRKLGVSDAQGPVRLRRRDERPRQRRLTAERDLQVRSTGHLQDGPRVLRDLARVDVARGARDGHELALGRGYRVQQCQAVVDACVAIDEDRDPVRGLCQTGTSSAHACHRRTERTAATDRPTAAGCERARLAERRRDGRPRRPGRPGRLPISARPAPYPMGGWPS